MATPAPVVAEAVALLNREAEQANRPASPSPGRRDLFQGA